MMALFLGVSVEEFKKHMYSNTEIQRLHRFCFLVFSFSSFFNKKVYKKKKTTIAY
jgi:hypothetical protein